MKLPTLDSLDHPLLFVFFAAMALAPIFVLMFIGARKAGII